MKRRLWHTAALLFEIVGVVMLFFWSWPQPSFETEDALGIGPSANARQIIAQKKWHSARALIGLTLLSAGCAIQLGLVWTDRRTAQDDATRQT